MQDRRTPAAPPGAAVEARREAAWARRLQIETGGQKPRGLHRKIWTRINPDSSPFTQKMLMAAFFVMGLRARGRRNTLDIEVREHELPVPRLPAGFDGFRILHLSDLHVDSIPEFPPALAGTLEGLAYDACFFTGDLRYRKHGSIEPALEGFRVVREAIHAPITMVLGNHDPSEIVEPLRTLGVRILINEATELKHGDARVHLVGVDDPHWFQADDLVAALDGVPDGECRILLAHAPELYEEAEARGIDLSLCGHTHGGQIALPGGWPPFLNTRCPRDLAIRDWQYGRMRGYTTVGAGFSSIPMRLQVRPEVVIHTLRADGSPS